MHFVNNIDFGAGGAGEVAHRINQLTDVVDASAAGGIQLQHIRMPVLADHFTMVANAAWVGRGAAIAIWPNAVERPGDNAGSRRFPNASNAGEQEGMGDAIRLKRIGQRAHQHLLANEIIEGGGAIFSS